MTSTRAAWRFGTVLQSERDTAIVMVVGVGGNIATDDGYSSNDNRAWGITIWVPPGTETDGAWGEPGRTTWIPGYLPEEGGWDWKVLDE